jgi:type I restriction-modification system DNA methylase subunit
MGSLVKEYKKEKLIGQIYTPDFIVSKILDDVGYTNAININNRKLLDPACGDGQFLKEVVKRIIKYSPGDKLLNNLENIVGWDIDDNDINWVTRQQMEGQTVFSIDQNFFEWRLLDAIPKYSELSIEI